MANGTFEEITKLGIQNRRPDLYRLLQKIGARPRGYAEIEIKRIKRDQGIYPREQTDWDRVEIYKEALEEGAVFPPVLVAAEPENLLLDGNHRINAHEQAGHEKIWIERWDIPKHYLKLVAQAANTEAGKIDTPLTGREKKKAIIQDWEDGIRDIELIATALKTTPSYVRKVLSNAGLIKSRKEQMKERAKELKEQGLSSRQIAERLSEEFGEEISYRSVVRWLEEDVTKITQVKNVTPTLEEKIEEARRFVKEEGFVPTEAYKRAGLPPDYEKRMDVIKELIRIYNEKHGVAGEEGEKEVKRDSKAKKILPVSPKITDNPGEPVKPIKEADTKPLVEQKWYWQRKWGVDEGHAKALVELARMDREEGKEVNEKLYIALANQQREEQGLPKYFENPNWQNEPHPFEIERQKRALSRSRADILWERFVEDIEELIKILDRISAVFDFFVFRADEEPDTAKYINDPELGGGWFVLKVLFKHIIDGDYDDTTYDLLKVLGEESREKMRTFLLTLIEKGAERYMCDNCKIGLENAKLNCRELVKKAAIQTLKAHGLKVEYYKDKHPYWFIKDILDKLEK